MSSSNFPPKGALKVVDLSSDDSDAEITVVILPAGNGVRSDAELLGSSSVVPTKYLLESSDEETSPELIQVTDGGQRLQVSGAAEEKFFEEEEIEKVDDGEAMDQPSTPESLQRSDNAETMLAFASSKSPPQNEAMPGTNDNGEEEKAGESVELATDCEENGDKDNFEDSHSKEDGFPKVEKLPEMAKGAKRTVSKVQACSSCGNAMESQPGSSYSAVLNASGDSISSPPLASPFFRLVSEAEADATFEWWNRAEEEFESEPESSPKPTPEEQKDIDDFAARFLAAVEIVDSEEKARTEAEKQKKKRLASKKKKR